MSRAKVFIQNFFIYGVLQVISKIVPFLLIPLITRFLPDTAAFGMYDMFSLIIGMGTPIAILGINDAIFREYFEKDDPLHGYDVTTTAHRIVFISSSVTSLLLIVMNKFASTLFFQNSRYGTIIILGAIGIWITSNYSIFQAPTRIQNKTRLFAFSALFDSCGYYLLALYFILKGTSYYGLIYSRILISIVLFLSFYWINQRFFIKGKYRFEIAKNLLKIGIPSLPTLLIYWLYNSMDRIMIMRLLGPEELGVYAIGAKMAQISLLIYMAFAGGWQYFAYSTMKNEDYKKMMGKVWEILFVISSCFYFFVFYIKDILFDLLFEGDYKRGVVVFPYLLLGPLLLMLFQVLSTQLNVVKKTYYTPIILSIGALLNILLNFFLIPRLGITGAAIATIIGYTMSLVVALLVVVKVKQLIIMRQGVLGGVLAFTILCIMTNINPNPVTKILSFLYIIMCILLYRKMFFQYAKILISK